MDWSSRISTSTSSRSTTAEPASATVRSRCSARADALAIYDFVAKKAAGKHVPAAKAPGQHN